MAGDPYVRGRITYDGKESRKERRQYCGKSTADSPQALRVVNDLVVAPCPDPSPHPEE